MGVLIKRQEPKHEPVPRTLNVPAVCAMVKLSRATLFRRIERGLFPLGTRHKLDRVWTVAEVEGWMKENPDSLRNKKLPA